MKENKPTIASHGVQKSSDTVSSEITSRFLEFVALILVQNIQR